MEIILAQYKGLLEDLAIAKSMKETAESVDKIQKFTGLNEKEVSAL